MSLICAQSVYGAKIVADRRADESHGRKLMCDEVRLFLNFDGADRVARERHGYTLANARGFEQLKRADSWQGLRGVPATKGYVLRVDVSSPNPRSDAGHARRSAKAGPRSQFDVERDRPRSAPPCAGAGRAPPRRRSPQEVFG